MPAPTAIEALGVWERGQGQNQAERGLALLALAQTASPGHALADVSIGARDAALVALREAMFGTRLDGCVNCPQCGETMEFDFNADAILVPPPETETVSVRVDGYALTLRAVTSRDLLALGERPAPDARLALLSRCVVDASHDGAAAEIATLPAPVLDAAAQALSDADPQADVRLAMACANCGYAWKATFDILSYLWTELDAWARRALHDVHTLARFYGWREADILAMSPLRRKFYLDMAAS
jgi:hypothetical protein